MSALPLDEHEERPTNRRDNGTFGPGNRASTGRPRGAVTIARKAREAVGQDGALAVEFHTAVATLDDEACRKWKLDPARISVRDRQDSTNWLVERGFGKALGFQDVQAGEDPFGDAHERLAAKLAWPATGPHPSIRRGFDASTG